MTSLILASASAARQELLTRAGVRFTVRVSGVDEDAVMATAQAEGVLTADQSCLLLARAKAEAVAATLGPQADELVLGCDSVFELDGQTYGKPGTPEVAEARWRQLRGRTGTLHTGHWLIDTSRATTANAVGAAVGAAVATSLLFADPTDDEIADYVASGEPLHVAGAFTLEGRASAFISRIDGDPSNVMGLSVPTLRLLGGQLGYRWPLGVTS